LGKEVLDAVENFFMLRWNFNLPPRFLSAAMKWRCYAPTFRDSSKPCGNGFVYSVGPRTKTRARGPRLAPQTCGNARYARWPPHPFKPDPSGGYSRTLLETDEDPNFKIVIRDFSFPPDRQSHTITLPSGAFLHLISGQAEISIARQRSPLSPVARTPVAAGSPIDVVNDGEHAVVVRVLIVQAK
jgi:hypothetical protein